MSGCSIELGKNRAKGWQFTFDWLDRVLAILDKHQIKVLLGVPSYSPPYWLLHVNPNMLLIDREGRRYRTGGLGYVNIFDAVYLLARRKSTFSSHLYFCGITMISRRAQVVPARHYP